MSDSVYSVIAYIARYWFAALAIIILWRAFLWLQKDADQKARVQSRLPDAGHIGEWAVLTSDGGMPEGAVIAATRDGWMGSARRSDVRVTGDGIPQKAARFYLKRDGLHLQPHRRSVIDVDGIRVHHEAVLRHGATVTLAGRVTIQLRLFAGILLEGETVVLNKRGREVVEVAYDPETSARLPTPIMVASGKAISRMRRRSRGTKSTRKEG